MTNLKPRCCSNIYYNNFYKYRDLLESVGLTLKYDTRYYTIGVEIVSQASLSDELWDAITWIQRRFWKVTKDIMAAEHKQENSKIVVSNYHYGYHVYHYNNNCADKPPKEAFDLVEGFIFINKYHEIPESIKRMMDEEEVEKILEG